MKTYKGHEIVKKGKMYSTKYLDFECSDLGMIKILIKNKFDNKKRAKLNQTEIHLNLTH